MLYFSLKTSKSKNFTCVILALGALLTLTACPSNSTPIKNIIKDFSLNTYLSNNDNWIEMKATVNTGGFKLGGMSFPITDPFNSGDNYGTITVNPSSNEASRVVNLTISMDISKISQIPASTSPTLLPNGKALPIGKSNQSKVISLPIESTGGQIYLAFGSGVAIVGATLPFTALDKTGKLFSGIHIFEPFAVGSASLTAGIFTGSAPKTSGFGIFANLSPILAKAILTQEIGIAEAEEDYTVFESTLSCSQADPNETQGILNLLHQMSFEDIVLEVAGSPAEDTQTEDTQTEDTQTEDAPAEKLS